MKYCERGLKKMLSKSKLSWLDMLRVRVFMHFCRGCSCKEYMQQIEMIRQAGGQWYEKHCQPCPEKVKDCENKVLERLRTK